MPELDLHGLTVDEALPKLDSYLYNAFVDNETMICINHGRGTGTLRLAVQRKLSNSSMVKSYRPGGYGEGGAGVTIVELAER